VDAGVGKPAQEED